MKDKKSKNISILLIYFIHNSSFTQIHKKEEESKRARVPSSLLHRRKKQQKEKGKRKKKPKEKLAKEKKPRIADDEDSDEERSIIELTTKPEVKNVKIEGVLPLAEAAEPQNLNEFVSKQSEENIQIMRKQAKLKRKRRKRKKKLHEAFEEQDEAEKARENLIREQLLKLDPTKAATKQDSSFYPAPKNLEKRRCYIHKNARALKCTVCDGGDLVLVFLTHFDPFPSSSLQNPTYLQV